MLAATFAGPALKKREGLREANGFNMRCIFRNKSALFDSYARSNGNLAFFASFHPSVDNNNVGAFPWHSLMKIHFRPVCNLKGSK